MKGLKKLALATAVAAAPFAANADLKALDDNAMGNVTGQAGVTIELETRVSIGEFTYTDEGTFAVSDIEIGGANASGLIPTDPNTGDPVAVPGLATQSNLLDDLKIDIDVAADGDAVIHVGSNTGAPIDWGMQVGEMSLRDNVDASSATENTTLISGMKAWGLLGALDIRVDTTDVAAGPNTGTLNLDAAFTVEQMDFEVDFLAVGITGLSIKGANAGGQTYTDAEISALLNDPNGEDPVLEGTLAALASGNNGANKSFAVARLDIYKGDNLDGTRSDVLRVDVDDVLMDVNIQETRIGGTNIGTIGIDNLHISDTTLAVYGK
ncbi:hypothetical protein DXI23_03980 [Marinobacter flavimaris]|uniref:DUF6160 domain-containing protein n=1 Tax=Marinobacter flavimaris TaxID=262076 RepID=A0A3D8H7Y8_9GAMM|nr:DUF6160 family protein [Marinobacter flavimaris]PPI79416.1 hypothetical protein MDHKLMBL_14765 [Marinobacter flavimaris]RDU42828.1 hypothetical protein DXI23_03980 [Marinobacter flavimaris]